MQLKYPVINTLTPIRPMSGAETSQSPIKLQRKIKHYLVEYKVPDLKPKVTNQRRTPNSKPMSCANIESPSFDNTKKVNTTMNVQMLVPPMEASIKVKKQTSFAVTKLRERQSERTKQESHIGEGSMPSSRHQPRYNKY